MLLAACGRGAPVEAVPDTPAVLEAPLAERVGSDLDALVARVVATHDHGGRPFAVIDKRAAEIHVLDGNGARLASAPVLLGFAVGDDSVPGIGSKAIADIAPHERTTPAGRFQGVPGRNADRRPVVWIDYDQALSMHVVITETPSERRLQRLASADPAERRISWGCVNLPAAFFADVVRPAFAHGGVVYILPETRALETAFPTLFARP